MPSYPLSRGLLVLAFAVGTAIVPVSTQSQTPPGQGGTQATGGQTVAPAGRGQAPRGLPVVQIGPPAPVPAEVAMLRPSPDELTQINAALQRFVATDTSSSRTLL